MDLPLPNSTPSPSPSPSPDDSLATLLAPSLSSLAADLNTTPTDLANLLSSPELTDKLAALITNLAALEHLRALAARAPATAVCRALLTTDNPVEQRRVAATLLRTPIHRPNRASTHQRPRRASQRSDAPHRTALQPPHSPDPTANPTRDLESLLSLLVQPPSHAAPPPVQSPQPGGMLAALGKHVPSGTPTTPAQAAPSTQPRSAAGMLAAPGKHVPPIQPATPAPTRPGAPTPTLNLPPAPTLQRRTPPTRAASLLTAAASTPPPHPRPP